MLLAMIYLYEDLNVYNLWPLVELRPSFELYCGAQNLKDKLKIHYPNEDFSFLIRPLLKKLTQEKYPQTPVNELKSSSNYQLFISARAILKEKLPEVNKETLFVNDKSDLIGFYLRADRLKKLPINEATIKKLKIPQIKVKAQKLNFLWEIIELNPQELKQDFYSFRAHSTQLNKSIKENLNGRLSPRTIILGSINNLYLGAEAEVEANVILDLRPGPIIIDAHAKVLGPCRIVGPAYIGPYSIIDQAYLHNGVTIGPHCIISGEVEQSIFQGYTNKHHYGFIGHSYIGEWVNLGAGTTNSDLKNNYSEVKVKLKNKLINTNLRKVGCFIGDHTKTGIGSLIPTGCLLGIFTNHVTTDLKIKSYSNFYWSSKKRWQLSKALNTAQVMMARRGVIMTQTYQELIQNLYRLK
jgi:UDP-N-acetylglucosamine diphosphorylase/glucosamine-1-phosphate N-acetyltransferase